jgi:hypothetical protein
MFNIPSIEEEVEEVQLPRQDFHFLRDMGMS